MSKANLRFEVGKRYVDSVGRVYLVYKIKPDANYPIQSVTDKGERFGFTATGKFTSERCPGSYDLVAEYTEQPTTQETPMDTNKLVTKTVNAIRPYQKYIVVVAILFVLDHFLLKGAIADKLQALARSLADRLIAILNAAVAKIGGPDEQG